MNLTIGIPTYDDYDGLYFTLQYHRYMLRNHSDVRFVVVDNNPSSEQGKATKLLCDINKTKYVPFSENRGTAAAKNEVVRQSDTDYVICMDSHVLTLFNDVNRDLFALKELAKPNTLYHANLVLDTLDFKSVYDAMTPDWGTGMLGKWRKKDEDAHLDVVYSIPMHGMGWFMVHRDTWVGFNDHFVGFGGEEFYIHEAYRQGSGDVKCVRDMHWLHRFNRPNGLPYVNTWEERLYNYYVGFKELGLPDRWQQAHDHYKSILSTEVFETVINKLEKRLGYSI